VGGIIQGRSGRVGARPIASMDCLFLGPPSDERSNFLREGVIKGIANYAQLHQCPQRRGA